MLCSVYLSEVHFGAFQEAARAIGVERDGVLIPKIPDEYRLRIFLGAARGAWAILQALRGNRRWDERWMTNGC